MIQASQSAPFTRSATQCYGSITVSDPQWFSSGYLVWRRKIAADYEPLSAAFKRLSPDELRAAYNELLVGVVAERLTPDRGHYADKNFHRAMSRMTRFMRAKGIDIPHYGSGKDTP